MITDFQIFEKKWIPKNEPNWFYLVLRVGDDKVWDSLMRMEFLNLKGISDHYGIAKHWFDIRELLVIMNGSEVLKLNKNLEPIEYFNPDFFCKQNFKYWRRLVMNDPQFIEYKNGRKRDITFTGALDKLFQNLAYRNIKKKRDGGLKFDTYHDKNGIINYIQDIHYTLSEKIDDHYHLGQLHINNLDDFVKIILEMLKEYVVDYPMTKDYPWKNWKPIEDYIKDKLEFPELRKLFSKAFEINSVTFETEGEWAVNDKSFKIPKGSILYFKEEGGRRVSDYSSHGMEKERIDNIIKEYGLDHIYQIKTVHNHIDMMNILKNEYSNKQPITT
jgi:hypothetical protein